MDYKLSPSDFTFLYDGCKQCYYLKVVHNISQPSIPLPSIFTQIAGLLKSYYNGKRIEELCPELPAGVVEYGEKYVKSEPIQLPGYRAKPFISGRFDIAVKFDDKTYGVIDFKTGNPTEKHSALYDRQLYAYAYALEHPAPAVLRLSPISKMGLLYFYPSKISQSNVEWISYDAKIHWIEINKDEQKFLDFIKEVLDILESPKPPEPSPDCQWCNYTDKLKNIFEI